MNSHLYCFMTGQCVGCNVQVFLQKFVLCIMFKSLKCVKLFVPHEYYLIKYIITREFQWCTTPYVSSLSNTREREQAKGTESSSYRINSVFTTFFYNQHLLWLNKLYCIWLKHWSKFPNLENIHSEFINYWNSNLNRVSLPRNI